ncbi:ATP-binding protein [Babesia caballi]|uniref:ATP-binding protein n=1 Tax=Babesia caballi TaxID=5871 RepID=A0AAV4LSJ1_BABCB|nr:ATP-binding protein [Babesia caballi]
MRFDWRRLLFCAYRGALGAYRRRFSAPKARMRRKRRDAVLPRGGGGRLRGLWLGPAPGRRALAPLQLAYRVRPVTGEKLPRQRHIFLIEVAPCIRHVVEVLQGLRADLEIRPPLNCALEISDRLPSAVHRCAARPLQAAGRAIVVVRGEVGAWLGGGPLPADRVELRHGLSRGLAIFRSAVLSFIRDQLSQGVPV